MVEGIFEQGVFRLFFALVLKGFCKFLSYFDFRSLTGVLMQRI